MDQDAKGWVSRTLGPEAAGSRSQGTGLTTFIDQGARFEGTLRLRETARIDGEFKGSIESGAAVLIGESAGIEADIRAREVFVVGAVAGAIHASRQLVLRPTGRVTGEVETACLVVEKGAWLNATTRMIHPGMAQRVEPAVEKSAPAARSSSSAAS